jgi:hypothetical protein
VWASIQSIFNVIIEAFKTVWASIQSIFANITDTFKGIWSSVEGIFKKVTDSFSAVWKNLNEKVVKPITDIGTKIWDGFKSAGDKMKTFFSDLGGNIWEGLKKSLSGLGDFFKNIFNKLDPSNLFAKIFKIDMKGKGTVENTLGIDIPFANFYEGGVVAGKALVSGDSKINDRILATLSAGEAVVPRSIMNDPVLGNLIKMVLSGDIKPQGFALGGLVGTVVEGAKDIGGQASDLYKSVVGDLNPWDIIKDIVFNDMIMNMLKANKFHDGGLVGGNGDVPSILQSGEYVVKRDSVKSIGLNALNSINSGSNNSNGSPTINIEMNITTTEAISESFVKSKLMPRLREELKKASLDGQFVLSAKGVR